VAIPCPRKGSDSTSAGAEYDLSFPGWKLFDRMKGLVPDVKAELIPGRYCTPTTDELRRWTADRVGHFVGGAVRV
jgi:hypothetical protein